jgi:hypothetical protein
VSRHIKRKVELGFIGCAVLALLLFWKENRALDRVENSSIFSCGDKLSPDTRSVLEQMNRDFRSAWNVLEIGTQRFLFMDKNGNLMEYRFSGSFLFRNRVPVLQSVNAFYFEFRDCQGNLLTHRAENCESVSSVGYTIRMQSERSEIFASSSARVAYHAKRSDATSTSLAFMEKR